MGNEAGRRTRWVLLSVAYATVLGLSIHRIGETVPSAGAALADVLAALAATVPFLGEAGLLVVLGLMATFAALASLWASPATGTGYGLLVAATLAVIVLPFAEVPWTGEANGSVPASVATLAGVLVALATIEVGVGARETVDRELRDRGLLALEAPLPARLVRGHRRWLAASLVLGASLALTLAVTRSRLQHFPVQLDVLWAPALAGLAVGLALWLWARR